MCRRISWACELKRSRWECWWWNEKGREVVKPSVDHEERCRIKKVHRCRNGTKKGTNSKKEMMGNQMKVVRIKKIKNDEQRISIQQGKSYHTWWSSREDTDSETLVKGYSTLTLIRYNNSDSGNKGSHKTKKSHEKLSSLQLQWKWLKEWKVLMEN